MYNTLNGTVPINCSENITCSNECLQRSQVTLVSLIGLIVANSIGFLFGTVGNVLVLVAIGKYSYMHTSPDFFIFSLASADLLVALVYDPLIVTYVILKHIGEERSKVHIICQSFVGYFSLVASVTSLCLVTVDRLVAIQRPLKYVLWKTSTLVGWIIGITWLFSAVVAAVYSILKPNRMFVWCYASTLLTAILLVYVYIFTRAQKQKKKITNNSKPATNIPKRSSVASFRNQLTTLKDLKATRRIGLLCSAYLLTWLPIVIYTTIVDKNACIFIEGFAWVMTASLFNSFINPYVYCITSNAYRKTFSKILGLSKQNNSACAVNTSKLPSTLTRTSLSSLSTSVSSLTSSSTSLTLTSTSTRTSVSTTTTSAAAAAVLTSTKLPPSSISLSISPSITTLMSVSASVTSPSSMSSSIPSSTTLATLTSTSSMSSSISSSTSSSTTLAAALTLTSSSLSSSMLSTSSSISSSISSTTISAAALTSTSSSMSSSVSSTTLSAAALTSTSMSSSVSSTTLSAAALTSTSSSMSSSVSSTTISAAALTSTSSTLTSAPTTTSAILSTTSSTLAAAALTSTSCILSSISSTTSAAALTSTSCMSSQISSTTTAAALTSSSLTLTPAPTTTSAILSPSSSTLVASLPSTLSSAALT